MTLQEKINEYKKIHGNCKHTFKSGEVVQTNLHDWLDRNYQQAVKEFRNFGTKNTADWLNMLIKC